MFPRKSIKALYRLLCLFAYVFLILFINSSTTLFIVSLFFIVLSITENRFENYFLYIITFILLIICLNINNYFLYRIILIIDFVHYYLNVDTLYSSFDEIDEFEEKNQKYIRFNKRKERDNNKLCTIFVIVHLVILLLAVIVG